MAEGKYARRWDSNAVIHQPIFALAGAEFSTRVSGARGQLLTVAEAAQASACQCNAFVGQPV